MEEIEKISRVLDDASRPFAEIVDAAMAMTRDDTDLGLITRDGLISGALAERAFSRVLAERGCERRY